MKKTVKMTKKAANRVERKLKKEGVYNIHHIIYRTEDTPYYDIFGEVTTNTNNINLINVMSGGRFNIYGRCIRKMDMDIRRTNNFKKSGMIQRGHNKHVKASFSNYRLVLWLKNEIDLYLNKHRDEFFYDADCIMQYIRELDPHTNARLYKVAMAMVTLGYNSDEDMFNIPGTRRILAILRDKKNVYRKTLSF